MAYLINKQKAILGNVASNKKYVKIKKRLIYLTTPEVKEYERGLCRMGEKTNDR